MSGKVVSLGRSEDAAEAVGWLAERLPANAVFVSIVHTNGTVESHGFGAATIADMALIGSAYQGPCGADAVGQR